MNLTEQDKKQLKDLLVWLAQNRRPQDDIANTFAAVLAGFETVNRGMTAPEPACGNRTTPKTARPAPKGQ